MTKQQKKVTLCEKSHSSLFPYVFFPDVDTILTMMIAVRKELTKKGLSALLYDDLCFDAILLLVLRIRFRRDRESSFVSGCVILLIFVCGERNVSEDEKGEFSP